MTAAPQPVLALLAVAGHRRATLHDAGAVLQLVAAAQRRHPGGLLGHSSRYLPRRVALAVAALAVLQSLVAGELAYDPASGAAIALRPQSNERRARRALAAAGAGIIAAVATAPVVLAVLGLVQFVPGPVPDAIPFVIIAGVLLGLIRLTRELRQRRRSLAAVTWQGPTVYAGS